MDTRESRGVRAGVGSYLLWGFLTVYWKRLAGLDAFQLIGYRIVLAALILTVFCVFTGRWHAVRETLASRSLRPFLVAASVLLVGNWTSYVWAVGHDRVIEAALGYFLAPLFMMLIGAFWFHEALTPLKIAALASTTVAVTILTISYGSVPWAGIAIATSWSLYGAIKKQVSLGAFTSLTSEVLTLSVPAAIVVAGSFTSTSGVGHQASAGQWPLILGTGLITVLPLILFSYAVQRVPLTLLGPLNFLVPIINFGLGWLVFDEPMPPSRFVGFLFVWFALILVTVDTVRNSRVRPMPVAAPKTVPQT